MRLSVIGTGYLGATHAACMAELGHDVVGIDVDEKKVASLAAGQVPFYEPGLPEILERNLAAGRLSFTTDMAAAADADIHFIGVGTPQQRGSYAADVSYVFAAVETLVPLLTKDTVIFGKSTVPVGTAAELQTRADELAPAGITVEIAWNPEFLREGFAVKDTLTPDRIVLGVDRTRPNTQAEAKARECYDSVLSTGTPFLVTDTATAELVKVSANAFLATKISFINAVSELCEIVGADVTQLADAIGLDERIGRRFLNAGLGFGGGCLPKDIRAFMSRAGELGADQALTFLREVDSVNMRRREKLVDDAKRVLGGSVLGKNIAVLGAAFKPNSDDVRDSPALSVSGALALAGAQVSVFDPQAMDNARRVFPTLSYAADTFAACDQADLVVVATEWQEFRELDPQALAKVVRGQIVIDGRNCLPVRQWLDAGWEFHALGRSAAAIATTTE